MSQRGLQEFIIPSVVVVLVGMMIVPLPSGVLDVLLSANIAFSLLLLLVTINTQNPERFTSLPSLLLLTTVFRLGLNISTTRQLLTYGEAPEVVAAFGEFVVGGNVLVGCVVFLIVTLVQFIVVSKGAERVAEVAARFTLDAMPGKQMAIDADIRAGILSLSEAKERRRELQRESKLYGALDGAMKFIKGDAIAGLCIVVLNITAGFFIGMWELGMTAVEALDRYTLFTIGDSLVSQVPALLVSIAAGVAVTRIGDSEDLSLAREFISQLTEDPRVLGMTSAVLGVLALCPGLPTLVFVFWALLLAGLGLRRAKDKRHLMLAQDQQIFLPRAPSSLLLCVGEAARGVLMSEGTLPRIITEERKAFYERFGVILPEPEWQMSREGDLLAVSVCIQGMLSGEIILSTESGGCGAQTKELFTRVCCEHVQEFIDDTQTRQLLDLLLASSEDLVNALIPKQITITILSRILRDLVAEGLSVRNLRAILQAIAEHCLTDGSIEYPLSERRFILLLAAVRRSMKRSLRMQLPVREGALHVWELHPELDRILSQAIQTSSPLSPALASTLAGLMSDLPTEEGGKPVICATSFARYLLMQVARVGGIPAFVVSSDEVPEDVDVFIRGTIGADSFGDESRVDAGPGLCSQAEVLPFLRKAA